MKNFVPVLLILLFWVGGCGQSPIQPPTGPGISQISPPADIATQLRSMGFVPDSNNPGKWLRPADNTTAEIGADGQITIIFQMSGGAVSCTTSAEAFGADMMRLEQQTDRDSLLNEPNCT